MQQSNVAITLIGLHNSGKTHFGAQLLGRLRMRTGELQMNGTASNLTPFEAALREIAEGRLAAHTQPEVYAESVWPVKASRGNTADLVWPDYGGEQVQQLLQLRRVGEAWQRRIRSSSGWLLCIRPYTMLNVPDVWERPSPQPAKASTGSKPFQWREQASMVELLQILLHIRRVDPYRPIASPPIVVVLTCWDELSVKLKALRPPDLLNKELPLLGSFIESNWREDRRAVFGVSALGKELRSDTSDREYQNLGASAHGWVRTPAGQEDTDLTLPVARLMEMAEEQ